MKLKAVFFDLDGTMVPNLDYHILAWQKAFENYKQVLTKETYQRLNKGLSALDFLKAVLSEMQLSLELASEIRTLKEEIYPQIYKGNISEVPGLIALISQLKAADVKLAVCSNSPQIHIDMIIEELGLKNLIDLRLSRESVSNTKPHPEMYLRALEYFSVDASSSIIFEDSSAGLEAAEAANIKAILVKAEAGVFLHNPKHNLFNFIEDYKNLNLDLLNAYLV